MTKVSVFDIKDYLKNSELLAEYISQILANGDIDELFETILKIMHSFDLKMQVVI